MWTSKTTTTKEIITMTVTDLGIYPTSAALDHDAEIHLRQAFDHLGAAGVDDNVTKRER